MAAYFCPDGHELQGTLEQVRGIAYAQPCIGEKGTIEPEYEGYTEVDWNSQHSVTSADGEPLWVCTEGDAFPVSVLYITYELGR